MANAVGDAAEPDCSEGDSAGTGARTGAGTGIKMRGDADGPERVESKVVNIITPDKTNKTPILVSY